MAINLGFVYEGREIIQRRRVNPLLVAAFDASTGRQAILGRRNDNTWVVRSENPYDGNSGTLLTHLVVQDQSFVATGSNFTTMLLYAYPDWAPGESGKVGMGQNLYQSIDDGLTWQNVPTYTDVLDIGGPGDFSFILHNGGTSLRYIPSGLFGTQDPNSGADILITDTFNRIGRLFRWRRVGTVDSFYLVMFGEPGVYLVEFTINSVSPFTLTYVATHGPIAYPGSANIPWDGSYDQIDNGSSPQPANGSWVLLQSGPGQGLFSLRCDGIVSGSGTWSTVYSAASSPTVALSAYLNFGTREFRYYNWNGSRIWIETELRPVPPAPSDQRGVFSGGEGVFGGFFPNVSLGLPPNPENIVEVDTETPLVIINIIESLRTLYLFLGTLPGEGSSPAYTTRRLVSAVRHNSGGAVNINDESNLLNIDGSSFTAQARRALSGLNSDYAVAWWRLLG